MEHIDWNALLLIFAPLLVELLNKLKAAVSNSGLPFWIKPILSAIIAALLGALGGINIGIGAAAGLTGSTGYLVKDLKVRGII